MSKKFSLREGKFALPTEAEVQAELIGIRDDLMVRGDGEVEGGEDDFLDVRLQVSDTGEWAVHYGDPGYDTDHSGYWGAASVAPGDTDADLLTVAQDLITQVEDAYSDAGGGVDDLIGSGEGPFEPEGDEDFDESKKPVREEKWSAEVETEWDAPEGFFNRSAEKIASGLKRASKDLKQAMSRLNFYINRAGSNLSAEDKGRLENAKEELRKLYGTAESRRRPAKEAVEDVDEIGGDELKLFIDNYEPLYSGQYMPIIKNLATKVGQGRYDHELSKKLWLYLVDAGAQKYAKKFGDGTPWHKMFSIATRRVVASEYADEFRTEWNLGNWKQYLPKKYAGKGDDFPKIAENRRRLRRMKNEALADDEGWVKFVNPRQGDKPHYIRVIDPTHVYVNFTPSKARAVAYHVDQLRRPLGDDLADKIAAWATGRAPASTFAVESHRSSHKPLREWWRAGDDPERLFGGITVLGVTGDDDVTLDDSDLVHLGIVHDGSGFTPGGWVYLTQGWGSDDESIQEAFADLADHLKGMMSEEETAEAEKEAEELGMDFDEYIEEPFDGMAVTLKPSELKAAVDAELARWSDNKYKSALTAITFVEPEAEESRRRGRRKTQKESVGVSSMDEPVTRVVVDCEYPEEAEHTLTILNTLKDGDPSIKKVGLVTDVVGEAPKSVFVVLVATSAQEAQMRVSEWLSAEGLDVAGPPEDEYGMDGGFATEEPAPEDEEFPAEDMGDGEAGAGVEEELPAEEEPEMAPESRRRSKREAKGLSKSAAVAKIKAEYPGLQVRLISATGEIRVAVRGKPDSEYFTNDPEDAVNTAKAMQAEYMEARRRRPSRRRVGISGDRMGTIQKPPANQIMGLGVESRKRGGKALRERQTALTPDLAKAAGLDAGNRSMRAAGRTVWNEEDYDAASQELTRLMRKIEPDNPTWWTEEEATADNSKVGVGESKRANRRVRRGLREGQEYSLPGIDAAPGLDDFTKAYIEALMWSASEDDEGHNLDDLAFGAIAEETVEQMRADCEKFQQENDDLLQAAYSQEKVAYDAEHAGHDFALTRNGHGAGFWDRGLGDVGDKLTDAAEAFGEYYLFTDDYENGPVFGGM